MTDEKPIAENFVVEFGSHADTYPEAIYVPGQAPRDIDVFFHGMSAKEARTIVLERYPHWTGPVDLNKVNYYSSYRVNQHGSKTWIEPCVKIPVPYDNCAAWKILCSSPVPPKVKITSVTGSLPSIFRARESWSVALERIQRSSLITICLEDREENPDDAKWPDFDVPLYGENNDRTSISKAVFDHFGEDNFENVCQNLWWGPFLSRFVREKPSKKGLNECEKHCPLGGRISVMVNYEHGPDETFFGGYGPCSEGEDGGKFGWTLEEFMTLLYR